MALFDESQIEASHKRLASSVSEDIEALEASTDLIRKALLAQNVARSDADRHREYMAASTIGFRLVNDTGAATRLLDCGYFVQATALIRDIAEIGFLFLDFAERPENLLQWSSAQGRDENKKFRAASLRKRVVEKRKFAFLDAYFDVYSELGTHPSSATITLHHDGSNFHIGPHYNAKQFVSSYRNLSRLVWHVCDAGGAAYTKIFGIEADGLYPAEVSRFAASWAGIPDKE